jgi:hypothetical protein
MPKLEDRLKLALAVDLIFFIIEVLTNGSDNKEESVKLLIDTWSKRVDNSANKLKIKYAKSLVEDKTDLDKYFTEDVAMILLDINSTENTIVKNEFTEQLQKVIFERLEKLKQ